MLFTIILSYFNIKGKRDRVGKYSLLRKFYLTADMEFTHFNENGHAKMVDVSEKESTERIATAMGRVIASPKTIELIKTGGISKGDVLAVAQVAGIMAAKKTSDIIPMCHNIFLTSCDISFQLTEDSVLITATAKTCEKTGVEMEALTAISTAALTVYDMCKAVDKKMRLTDIRLVYKAGGRSGEYKESEL